MPVHIFPVESVPPSLLQGDSIARAYPAVRDYLRGDNHSGFANDKYLECGDRATVVSAINEFVTWSGQLPQSETKLLWVSLHGARPRESEQDVGIRGVSATREPIDWWDTLSSLCGKCPSNVVVLMDVCWGASPAAPAALTKGTGVPSLLFGPVRDAHRLELDTATGLVVSALARGVVPTATQAKRIVRTLNAAFPPDPKNNKPFYRVWWWNKRGDLKRFPDAPEHKIRRS
jgi:hypothetical protein